MYRDVRKNTPKQVETDKNEEIPTKTPKKRATRTSFHTKHSPNLTVLQKSIRTCKNCGEMFMTVSEKKAHMNAKHRQILSEENTSLEIEEVDEFED